jgi:hypothetical protein
LKREDKCYGRDKLLENFFSEITKKIAVKIVGKNNLQIFE